MKIVLKEDVKIKKEKKNYINQLATQAKDAMQGMAQRLHHYTAAGTRITFSMQISLDTHSVSENETLSNCAIKIQTISLIKIKSCLHKCRMI